MFAEMKNIPDAVAQAVVGLLAPHSKVKTIEELKVMLSTDSKGDRIMNQKEAEEFTRLSYWTLERANQAGALRVLRAGRKRLYRQSDLEKYLMGE